MRLFLSPLCGLLLVFSAATLRAQGTIVLLGSSTAAGSGATNKDSSWAGRYAAHLAKKNPAWTLVNLAVGGFTTYHIMPTGFKQPSGRAAPDVNKNITKALTHNPKAIIINMPSNDAASSVPLELTKANFDTVVNIAKAKDIPVWVCTPGPRNMSPAQNQALVGLKDWIVMHFEPRTMDFFTTLAKADGTFEQFYDAGDHVHLNDRGHKLLYERAVAEDVVGQLTVVALASAPGRIRVRVRADAVSGFDISGRFIRKLSARALPAGPLFR